MKKKVIAAGHICLDITPVFPVQDGASLGEIFTPGSLIHTGPADVHTGGAVANTGLAMKLLGADVSLMGKVGQDAFGELVRGILEKYGAGEKLLVSEGESTSYSVVLAIPGTDRIFLHNPGANDTFCADDISQEELKETALFHFGYPPLMRRMYEQDGAELTAVLKKARKAGAAVSLDLAAVDEKTEAGKADWDKILKNVLPYVDFFVPSAEELCFMLDKPRLKQWRRRAAGRDITEILDVEEDIRPLAGRCMEYGAKVLLIKCGARGIYYRTAKDDRLAKISARIQLDTDAWADQEGFEESYVPERVLSATGAGDTCIAAFLTAVLKGETLQEAMHLAAAAGASCVAAYDALGGLPSYEELKQKIAAGWKKAGKPEALGLADKARE